MDGENKATEGPALQQPSRELPTGRRRFGDLDATRGLIYDNVLKAAGALPPLTNAKYTINLGNLHYDGDAEVPIAKQKEAILNGRSLTRRLRGTWQLIDNASGVPISEQTNTVAHVPHLTQRGTFIVNLIDHGSQGG